MLIRRYQREDGPALQLYRTAGYVQVREEVAEAATNKTVGSGLRRFHFEKVLRAHP